MFRSQTGNLAQVHIGLICCLWSSGTRTRNRDCLHLISFSFITGLHNMNQLKIIKSYVFVALNELRQREEEPHSIFDVVHSNFSTKQGHVKVERVKGRGRKASRFENIGHRVAIVVRPSVERFVIVHGNHQAFRTEIGFTRAYLRTTRDFNIMKIVRTKK